MHGESPPTSRSITIRLSAEQYAFVHNKSLEGYRSMNRQFGQLIDEAMKTEKASGQLAGTPDASHHHE